MAKEHKPAVCPDAFVKHLEHASRVVRTWPAWKQELLGGKAEAPRAGDEQVVVSEMGKRLRAARKRIVDSGQLLLSWDEIEKEVRDRR